MILNPSKPIIFFFDLETKIIFFSVWNNAHLTFHLMRWDSCINNSVEAVRKFVFLPYLHYTWIRDVWYLIHGWEPGGMLWNSNIVVAIQNHTLCRWYQAPGMKGNHGVTSVGSRDRSDHRVLFSAERCHDQIATGMHQMMSGPAVP